MCGCGRGRVGVGAGVFRRSGGCGCVCVCVYAGVAVGTGVGASRRGSGLGSVARVGAWAGVWTCSSNCFFVFSFQFQFFLVFYCFFFDLGWFSLRLSKIVLSFYLVLSKTKNSKQKNYAWNFGKLRFSESKYRFQQYSLVLVRLRSLRTGARISVSRQAIRWPCGFSWCDKDRMLQFLSHQHMHGHRDWKQDWRQCVDENTQQGLGANTDTREHSTTKKLQCMMPSCRLASEPHQIIVRTRGRCTHRAHEFPSASGHSTHCWAEDKHCVLKFLRGFDYQQKTLWHHVDNEVSRLSAFHPGHRLTGSQSQ